MDTPLQKALREYADTLETALELANDPYKAPEQIVATAGRVIEAAWNLQVAYAAMLIK